jgi:Zn finger protein HypA/HybF involved in hydrogenase expression
MIEKKSNRHKRMQATKHKFWCGNCDAALVGEWGKCPVCGSKENKKKKKG